jgi:phenylacetate-coenzyme A ligase PaaK-like adenylate-forming protein
VNKLAKAIQKFLTANPKRAIWFMSAPSAEFWKRQGEKSVLANFHFAAEKVPAYKDFLKKHGVKDHEKIKTIEEFKKYVPIIDKKNYLQTYPLDKMVSLDIRQTYVLSMSGGSTGKPIYHLSSREDFELFPAGMTAIFDYFWDICSPPKRVLFINAFAMGIWTGGSFGTFVLKKICDKYKTFSLLTPGADPERVVDILENIGKHFEINWIAAYPTLLKLILDEGDRRGLDWKSFNIKIATGGEMLDAALYEYITEKVASKKQRLSTIFESYGGTEIGAPGFVTPLARMIKLLTIKKPTLSKAIFGNKDSLGSLFQFNPTASWVESIGGEIVVSKNGYMPLIRYNTHDLGYCFSFSTLMEILQRHKIAIEDELDKEGFYKPIFNWPFLTLTGRKDWAIALFGAKIAPQSLQPLINRDERILSFKISDRQEDSNAPQFMVYLQLKPSVNLSKEELAELEKQYSQKILNYLINSNFDFKDAYEINKEIATPKVKIYTFAQGPFLEDAKRIKPKLIQN